MYEVRWTNPAFNDLVSKVHTVTVRRYLLAVSRSALDRHPGDWGGRFDDGPWWRRGIAPHDEADPDAVPGGPTGDGPTEMPYDFVLVYLRAAVAQRPRPFLVLGVATNPELVAGSATALFADGRTARWSAPHGTPGVPRARRRPTRRPDDGAGGRR